MRKRKKGRERINKFYFNVLRERETDHQTEREETDQWEKSKHIHMSQQKKTQTHINIEVGPPGIGGVNR